MIKLIQLIIQYIAISSFGILTIIELIKNPINWNWVGLNFSLVLLYIFLYLQPFK